MIVGITIKNFKGIKEIVNLPLSRFHVLVGPNGSGKSTFLDAIDFVKDCLNSSPAGALEARHITDFRDLTWMRRGGAIEIALWLDFSGPLPTPEEQLLHYRLVIETGELGVTVADELLCQYPKKGLQQGKPLAFQAKVKPKRLLGKTAEGTDFYVREKGHYQDSFSFSQSKCTLALTPPDEERYPTANAVRRFLMQGIRFIQLNSAAMRLPCPATRPSVLELDGSNIARVVGRLLQGGSTTVDVFDQTAHRGRNKPYLEKSVAKPGSPVSRWMDHVAYGLPNLKDIACQRRVPDNAEYLVVLDKNGFETPSWMLSDGTLRMLALTLLAFLPSEPAFYMMEEPEKGVHPMALEIVLRSLSTIPMAQVLLTTHSPSVVQQCGTQPLLCFIQDDDGVHITAGDHHPGLEEWDGTPELGTVFAAGILE